MSADLEMGLPLIRIPSHDQDDEIDGQDCHTPRSPEHRIPAIVSCPPPPRKKKRVRRAAAAGMTCKRRPCERLEFFEVVGREEVESFFRSLEVNFNGSLKRKRGV